MARGGRDSTRSHRRLFADTAMPAPESFEFELGRNDADCHILPCSINYEGPVDLSKFPIETSPRLFTRLRGRPLHGRQVDLATHGYCGVSLDRREAERGAGAEPDLEDEAAETEFRDAASQQRAQCSHTFRSITVWEHGKEPAADDAWAGRLEDLLRMSSAMEKLQTL